MDNCEERFIGESGRAADIASAHGEIAGMSGERDGEIVVLSQLFVSLVAALQCYAKKAEEGEYTNATPQEAGARITLIEGYWNMLKDAYAETLKYCGSELLDELFTKLEITEKAYAITTAALKERSKATGESQVVVKMPQMLEMTNTWGEFDGNVKKWLGFRYRFVAAVHDNQEVPPAYKFQHLCKSMVVRLLKLYEILI